MVSQPTPPRLTIAEFISMENASEVRHEYDHGHFWAMVGAKPNHRRLVTNITVALHALLKKQGCSITTADTAVMVGKGRAYFYPDATIICGPELYYDDTKMQVVNPTVIFEVLSPSTEAYDRGRKFTLYRQIETLQAYVLIQPDTVQVEIFRRAGELWSFEALTGTEATLRLASVGVEVTLAALYSDVELTEVAEHDGIPLDNGDSNPTP
jgi:Uma2 family endonuclease